MISINKTFEWDMGHRVTNHASLCKNLHGHRYKMVLSITGPIKDQSGSSDEGMIIDFGEVKRLVNSNVIDKLDHAFMYWEKDKLVSSLATQNPSLKMVSVPFVPTAECIAQDLSNKIKGVLSRGMPKVRIVKLKLYETPSSSATWEEE